MRLNASPREYARFGLLVGNTGRVNDRQIIPEDWLNMATSVELPHAPADFYAAHRWAGTPDGEPFPADHAPAWGNTYGTEQWPRPEPVNAAELWDRHAGCG